MHAGADRKTITRLIQKIEHTDNVCDNMRHNLDRKATVSTPVYTTIPKELFERSPRKSVRRTAQEAGINRESLRQIVVKELKLFPHKFQVYQPL